MSSRRKPQYLTAKRKMILTNCAACAAPLAHDAPRCVRCRTRYCNAMSQFGRLAGAKKLLNEQITIARHRGPDDKTVLTLRAVLAETIIQEDDPTEAVTVFEDVDRRMRRVLGPAHPQSLSVRAGLEEARAKLLAFHDAADGA